GEARAARLPRPDLRRSALVAARGGPGGVPRAAAAGRVARLAALLRHRAGQRDGAGVARARVGRPVALRGGSRRRRPASPARHAGRSRRGVCRLAFVPSAAAELVRARPGAPAPARRAGRRPQRARGAGRRGPGGRPHGLRRCLGRDLLPGPARRAVARGGDRRGERRCRAQRRAPRRHGTPPLPAGTDRNVNLIEVPRELDERGFDTLVNALVASGGGRVLVDARRTRWLDPYGMLGLLAVGSVAGRSGERPLLQLPAAAEVQSYLDRMGFLDQAAEIYELHGALRRGRGARGLEKGWEVLREITPVRSHAAVHPVVDRVHERATVLLAGQLGYPRSEAMQFSVILSEVCQNIIEHAGADGWVAAQTYSKTRQLDRRVVRIAVMD